MLNYNANPKDLTTFYRGIFRLLGDRNGLHYFKFLAHAGLFQWATLSFPSHIDFSYVFREQTLYAINNYFVSNTSRKQEMINNYTSISQAIQKPLIAKKLHLEILENASQIFQYEKDNIKTLVIDSLKKIKL